MSEPIFESCPCCGKSWPTRDGFLSDETIVMNGYQADFEILGEGLFYFTHSLASCCSTMTLPAKMFLDLYSGPRYAERKSLSEDCPRYCYDKEQLSRCDVQCECAFVREVVHIIKSGPVAKAEALKGDFVCVDIVR